MEEKFTVGVIVSKTDNVLTRVTGLFSKRGFNIHSIVANETDDARLSRITIVASGDSHVKEQVLKQLSKLIDVKEVLLLDKKYTYSVETMLSAINY